MKTLYETSQFESDVKLLGQKVQIYCDEVSSENMKWCPDAIVAIARGGLVPGVWLSHQLGLPLITMTWQLRDGKIRESLPYYYPGASNILLVDDINDSGVTFTEILDDVVSKQGATVANVRKRIKTACLYERSTSKFRADFVSNKINSDDWIVFPWEKE